MRRSRSLRRIARNRRMHPSVGSDQNRPRPRGNAHRKAPRFGRAIDGLPNVHSQQKPRLQALRHKSDINQTDRLRRLLRHEETDTNEHSPRHCPPAERKARFRKRPHTPRRTRTPRTRNLTNRRRAAHTDGASSIPNRRDRRKLRSLDHLSNWQPKQPNRRNPHAARIQKRHKRLRRHQRLGERNRHEPDGILSSTVFEIHTSKSTTNSQEAPKCFCSQQPPFRWRPHRSRSK